MTLNEIVSGAIFAVFTGLLVWGAASTTLRWARYVHAHRPQPVLLRRDRDMLIGLAVPFVIIAAVRAFALQDFITDDHGHIHLWYLLLTGLPPIYALARYVFFETRVIERPPRPRLSERTD